MADIVAGDLVLVQGTAWTSRRIKAGQRRHDPKWCWATHCAIMVTDTHMVEALTHGVERSPLSKYDHVKHAVVPVTYSDPAVRQRAIDFANHAIGRQYGLLEDASLAVYCYTGTRIRTVLDNQLICSALVAEALSREFIFPFEPLLAMPAHLTKFFGVTEPVWP